MGKTSMSKTQKEIQIDGFSFRDEELIEKAKREYEGIKYIRRKTSMDNPHMVKQVYDKILEQKLFETPVGIAYLRELQEYLKAFPGMVQEEVQAIPVEEMMAQSFVPAEKLEKQKQKAKSGQWLKMSLAGNVALVLMVIAMFVITMTSQHPNILNYEEKLLNRYASWEEELSNRERQVLEKERELGIEP